MNFLFRLNILAAGLIFCAAASAAVYPLKVSSLYPRVLVDQSNTPVLLVGDSAHSLIVNLSTADAAFYLADRATNGFNTIWVQLLCVPYTGGRADGSLLGGTLPFTNKIQTARSSSYDLTTPNEAYFAHVDQIVSLAASNGIQLMLDPLDTGGLIQTALNNGAARCRAYGQYLGNRYKNSPNIIWLNGNDFQGWKTATNDAVIEAIALGIKDNDTNHLQTVELNYYASSSLDDTNWNSLADLNLAYSYYPTYDEVLHAYQQSTNAPVFMGEAHYEFESVGGNVAEVGTPLVLRHQEYWTLLSGAAGQLYGNGYTWPFLSGWQTNLDSTGVTQLQNVTALFAPRDWPDLVPDTNHTVLLSGYGSYATNGLVSTNYYATAASTGDGTLALAYLPTVRTVTINLATFGGPVTAQWYDPANGKYLPINGQPFADSGTQDFTPPGDNSAGDPDWILVLETIVGATGISPAATTNSPTLLISLTPTNTVVVTWPGYILQETSNQAGANWVTVTNAITVVRGQYQTSILTAAGQQYRLTSNLPVPRLKVFIMATNAAVFSWSGYQLEQNSDLTATGWTLVTNAITVNGSQYQVTTPATDQQFFRLQYIIFYKPIMGTDSF